MAIFLSSRLMGNIFNFDCFDPTFEFLVVETFYSNTSFLVGALYHPPKPKYNTNDLIIYLEKFLDFVAVNKPGYELVICGDFNAITDSMITNLGLISVNIGPTHRVSALDRIYTSQYFYSNVKVFNSSIHTSHKCVIASSCDTFIKDVNKTTHEHYVRKRSPSQHANMLNFLSTYDWQYFYSLDCTCTGDYSVQVAFDLFYSICYYVLDTFYPLIRVKLTSRDPPYITPYIKLLLNEKKKLLKSGRIDKADFLSNRIGAEIAKFNHNQLQNFDNFTNPKEMWETIRTITSKRDNQPRHFQNVISANELNDFFQAFSADPNYARPQVKNIVPPYGGWVTEQEIFNAISTLKATSEGPDLLPFWFLKVASPIISLPIAFLFNVSYATGVVPSQWKQVTITPIPKIASPKQCADYRPISISSILSRVFEKMLIRLQIYPSLTEYYKTHMKDQFAFRPLSSTTCALIAMLDCITKMLATYPYVHFITFDMSKAFDTVRHATLADKLAHCPISDNTYNWIINYLTDRSHCTKFDRCTSSFAYITASVVQGSALGPFLFSVNATDFIAVVDGNVVFKYADDFDLLVPSCNSPTISDEIDNLELWASNNNLRLNRAKTKEMIIFNKYNRNFTFPTALPTVQRVETLKVLGITIDQKLTFSHHVNTLLAEGSRRLYALKVLKQHGLTGVKLYEATRAILINKICYGAPSWVGFCSQGNLDSLSKLIDKAVKWGVYYSVGPSLVDIFKKLDSQLLKTIKNNQNHTLHSLLPTVKPLSCQLRHEPYAKSITTRLQDNNFINRTVFKLQ